MTAVVGATPQLLVAVFGVMVIMAFLTAYYDNSFDTVRIHRAEEHHSLARTLSDYGYFEEAAEQYSEALLLDRNRFESRLGLALALYYSKRYEEARNQLLELRQRNPTDALTNLLLGRLARRDGRLEEAISSYRTAIYGRWPNNSDQNRLNTRFELIDLLEAQGGSSLQVVSELLTVMEEEPDNPQLSKRVAGILLEYGATEEALRIYRQLESRGLTDDEILAGMGLAHLRLANFSMAAAYLEGALSGQETPDYELQSALSLAQKAQELDPTARRLGPRQRFDRSLEVLERTVGYLEYCINPEGEDFVGPPAPLPDTVASSMELAQERLETRRPEDLGEALEANLLVAENLWRLRDEVCVNIIQEDPPLALVLGGLAR